MTTLPQTTGIRLPRPIGSGPPAVGGMLAPGMPGAPSAAVASGMTAADIWRVIRANLWLIAALFVFSGVVGVAVNWYLAKFHSRYTAVGLVAVEPRQRWDPMGKRDSDYVDWGSLQIEQRTHASLLTSEALLKGALSDANSPVRGTTWFKHFQVGTYVDVAKATEDLIERFGTTPITDSKLIKVEMSAPDKKEAKLILEHIVNLHLEEQQKINNALMLDRTTTLTTLKSKYETEIRELEDRRNELLMQISADVAGDPSQPDGAQFRLREMVKKQIELDAAATVARVHAEALERKAQKGKSEASSVEEAREASDSAAAVAAAHLAGVEKLRASAGDLAISAADYRALSGELENLRQSLHRVRELLSQVSNTSAHTTVRWAQRVSIRDD